jgi:hypothetical protein
MTGFVRESTLLPEREEVAGGRRSLHNEEEAS